MMLWCFFVPRKHGESTHPYGFSAVVNFCPFLDLIYILSKFCYSFFIFLSLIDMFYAISLTLVTFSSVVLFLFFLFLLFLYFIQFFFIPICFYIFYICFLFLFFRSYFCIFVFSYFCIMNLLEFLKFSYICDFEIQSRNSQLNMYTIPGWEDFLGVFVELTWNSNFLIHLYLCRERSLRYVKILFWLLKHLILKYLILKRFFPVCSASATWRLWKTTLNMANNANHKFTITLFNNLFFY
jgi:hypothetical protein